MKTPEEGPRGDQKTEGFTRVRYPNTGSCDDVLHFLSGAERNSGRVNNRGARGASRFKKTHG